MGLCLHFKSIGHKVFYNAFDQTPDSDLLNQLQIPFLPFTVDESAEIYIGNKLGSKTIGRLVLKAPFFKSLYQMMPGLASMILLGHLIKFADENPDASIVIDSPSTGHARVFFEATQNYRDMFGSGLIVEDIKRMQNFLAFPNNLKTIICSLPSELPLEEGKELLDYLKNSKYGDVELVLNDSLLAWMAREQESVDSLPEGLKAKINLENNLLQAYGSYIGLTIPKFIKVDKLALIREISLIICKSAY